MILLANLGPPMPLKRKGPNTNFTGQRLVTLWHFRALSAFGHSEALHRDQRWREEGGVGFLGGA